MARKPKPLTTANVVNAVNALDGRKYNPGCKADPMADCMYTYEDGAHCLVGQALVDLGHPVPEFDSVDNQESVSALLHSLDLDGVEIGAGVEEILQACQDFADQGKSWGRARILAGVR